MNAHNRILAAANCVGMDSGGDALLKLQSVGCVAAKFAAAKGSPPPPRQHGKDTAKTAVFAAIALARLEIEQDQALLEIFHPFSPMGIRVNRSIRNIK